MGACRHSYSEFANQIIYQTGALDLIFDNKQLEMEL
jgi:lactam utilization protein B